MTFGKTDSNSLLRAILYALGGDFLKGGVASVNNRALGPIRQIGGTGAFAALASVACKTVIFTNTSGVDWQVRKGASGATVTIPTGSGKQMDGNRG
jgi:hypothetical protein